jgi:Zn-dependent protease with chaperone function
MLLLFLLDFVFAFTVNKYCFKHKNYKKHDNLKFLDDIFDRIKQKFNFPNVELLISESSNINAYAVGSFRKNVIILTMGLLSDYSDRCNDRDKFLKSVEGIVAHEMSHIVNKDYFPSLLLITNERVLGFISKIVLLIFNILIKIVSFAPICGKYLAIAIKNVYRGFDYIIYFFYSKIALNIYKFFQLQISKQIEYRADRQASEEVGGANMSFALSLLGKSGFFNVFSTHPKTQNRVKKASKISINNGNIRSVFLSNTCFFLSFFILIFLSVKTFDMANTERMLRDSRTVANILQDKYIIYKYKIINLLR